LITETGDFAPCLDRWPVWVLRSFRQIAHSAGVFETLHQCLLKKWLFLGKLKGFCLCGSWKYLWGLVKKVRDLQKTHWEKDLASEFIFLIITYFCDNCLLQTHFISFRWFKLIRTLIHLIGCNMNWIYKKSKLVATYLLFPHLQC